ncbi:Phenylserine dehydratase [compost metagenome]
MACRVPHPQAFALVREHAARIVRVTDSEVAEAMRVYHEATHNTAEGAGAAALAALMQEREQQAGKRVAVVLSGANVDRARYARILGGNERS